MSIGNYVFGAAERPARWPSKPGDPSRGDRARVDAVASGCEAADDPGFLRTDRLLGLYAAGPPPLFPQAAKQPR
jgi:hypothetical protein